MVKPLDQQIQTFNPGKQLSFDRLTSLKEFMPLFKLRRDELQVELLRLEEAFNSTGFDESQMQAASERTKLECLLQLVNMFLFHAHILLRKCDESNLVSAEERSNLKVFFFTLLKNE